MLRQIKQRFTPEEYLAMESVAKYKSEYYDGEIFAMSGGTPDHSLVAVNLTSELSARLDDRPCRVFNSDMRLLIEESGLYTYPDGMVICGKIELATGRNDTVTNPVLIIEVLSGSTKEYDLSAKFDFYKKIASLKEYLVVDSERPYIECYRRGPDDQWLPEVSNDLNKVIRLDSVGCEIPMRNLYRKVSWLS